MFSRSRSFTLAVLALLAAPVFAGPILSLPCGPTSVAGCDYHYNTTSTVTTEGSGSSFYSEPGRTLQGRWGYSNTVLNDYAEYAGSDILSWWQGTWGNVSTETISWVWSDDFRYGCCNPDWWEDFYSAGSYYSRGLSGWGVALYSDRINVTETIFGWGNWQESWSNYNSHSGAMTWPNGGAAFGNSNWSDGGNSSNYKYLYQYTYPDEWGGKTSVPEPATVWMLAAGLFLIAAGKIRRWRACLVRARR
ncbi:MAG: PEP-CTERM sorting domain-containing protein [Patescibacteria group bacterium]